jgi:hypothetical protein
MNDYKGKDEWSKKVRREPRKPQWEVNLPTVILWHDQNTYHYRDCS